ncbi:MAG: oxidoreductase-like domain-containing protein [Burkholderiales bacterium]
MKPDDDDPRPLPPPEPHPDECCGKGCDPCVYDRYGEALSRYRKALKAWEARERGRRPRP